MFEQITVSGTAFAVKECVVRHISGLFSSLLLFPFRLILCMTERWDTAREVDSLWACS